MNRVVFVLFFCLLSYCPSIVYAHDFAMPGEDHQIRVVLARDSMVVDYLSILLTEQAKRADDDAMDANRDGVISDSEREIYLNRMINMLKTRIGFQLDRKDQDLIPVFARFRGPKVQNYHLKVEFKPSLKGKYKLFFSDLTFPNILAPMKIVLDEGTGVRILGSSLWNKDFSPRERTIRILFSSNLPDATATKEELNDFGVSPRFGVASGKFTARLQDIIKEPRMSLKFLVFALLFSIVLGALHALTPGHGKTIVAAYLIGTKGRLYDAITLGTIVTITHTSSVILLGLVTLFASKYILPQQIFPWLGTLSGILIIVIGFWLFFRRLSIAKAGSYTQMDGSVILYDQHTHNHSHVLDNPNHTHSHEHENDEHDHVHDEHHHDTEVHVRSHGGKAHSHEVQKGDISLWSLISLGVSGGIVPCPDALVVLLIAVALNRIGFGLAIIAAFSFGLALVLITIGILMVVAKPFITRFTGEGKFVGVWLPIGSSVVVIILGFIIAVSALIKGGIITINV